MINKSVNLESKSISCKRIVWLSPVSHLRYDIQACVMINWTAENGEIIDGSCHVAAIKWIVYTSVWRSSLATICDMWFTATHFSRKMSSNWFNFSVAPVCCYDNAHIILQYRWHSFRASMFQYFNASKAARVDVRYVWHFRYVIQWIPIWIRRSFSFSSVYIVKHKWLYRATCFDKKKRTNKRTKNYWFLRKNFNRCIVCSLIVVRLIESRL